MIKNKMKQILKEGGVALGAWINLAEPVLVEIIGHIGYDFVVLEYEHVCRGLNQIEELISAADSAQIPAFVRIKEKSDSLIQQLLDAGAMGIIAAFTATKEDAIKVVRAAKYPPLGVRGVAFATRATKFAQTPAGFAQYAKKANEQTMVFALIENREGVENVTDIASVDGLDGLDFGSADLSFDLGIPGQHQHPMVLAARERVIEACKSQGKYLLLVCADPARMAEMVKLGPNILVLPHDIGLIRGYYVELLKRMKAAVGR
jgi:4-hydroxy-2-oxoheptanedioate aldolase